MSLKHAKTSAKADGGDASLVRPGDWNAEHVASGTVDWTGADLKLRRLSVGGATALVAGDFALSSGWGNTAAVSAVIGTDGAWKITVTCGGTGIAANPTITLTFKDGAFSSAPIGLAKQSGGTGLLDDVTGDPGTTTWVLTYGNTPVSGKTYIFTGITVGRF